MIERALGTIIAGDGVKAAELPSPDEVNKYTVRHGRLNIAGLERDALRQAHLLV